jgi:hypothetical protein
MRPKSILTKHILILIISIMIKAGRINPGRKKEEEVAVEKLEN